MRWLSLVLLGACAEPPPLDTDATEVVVRTWLKGAPKNGAGSLVLQLEMPTELAERLSLPIPKVDGLEFTERDARIEEVGDAVVVTRTLRFSGQPGHYTIPPLAVRWDDGGGEQVVLSTPLVVDLDQESLRPGELIDIAEPEQVWASPSLLVYGAAGVFAVALIAGVGFGFVILARPRVQAVPAEPPDRLALRAWEAVRLDPDLSDMDKALAISAIFRDYTEAVLTFPASSWTTTQIVSRLAGMSHLSKGNVPRARRLLGATDRIKYAGEDATEQLFEDLDADLRAFVEATRPREWAA